MLKEFQMMSELLGNLSAPRKNVATGSVKRNPELCVEIYTVADALDLKAGLVVEKQLEITKPGYMPIGIVGYDIAKGSGSASSIGMSYLHFYKLHLMDVQPGSCTIETYTRNVYTSNATNISLNVYVLWQSIT